MSGVPVFFLALFTCKTPKTLLYLQSNQPIKDWILNCQMTYDSKTLQQYEKELKDSKKKFDKLSKQYRKCTSYYQAELLYDDLSILSEDISQLKLLVKEMREEKKLAKLIENGWI